MKVRCDKSVCEWAGVEPQSPEAGTKLGIALSTLGLGPVNGLRHNPENSTNGWYIWCAGEMPQDDDFFSPLHFEHIEEYLPGVREYLDLPPGFRFLIDSSGYEDVWYDGGLLNA
jgi:hypothetical protein